MSHKVIKMDMIDKLALDLTDAAKENYEESGYIIPAVLLVMGETMYALPQKWADMMNSDKEKFSAVVRMLVKKHDPLAVAIITEAYYLDLQGGAKPEQPSKSKDSKECVLVTVDSREKQVTYHAEIRNRKLGRWVKYPVFIKNGGEVEASGNIVDFYGTGSVLDVPTEMFDIPIKGAEAPKIC